MRQTILASLSFSVSVFLASSLQAHADGVSYDGSKFSQIPVISPDASGNLNWNLLDPSKQKVSSFTTGLGRQGDQLIIANWLYKNVTSAGVVSGPNPRSGDRMVWTIRTKVKKKGRKAEFQTVTKYLGRAGDLVITGGDFDGDKFADALVVRNAGGNWKWGLRAEFFLKAYNPSLHANRAYFDFGRVGADIPFYMNPKGKGDWFALLSPSGDGGYKVELEQAFSKARMTIPVGNVPDGSNAPIPIKQDDGKDFMVFYKHSGSSTFLSVKNLSGSTVSEVSIPINGEITVGNYGPGPGQEVAVSSNGTFYIYNPITERLISMNGPSGLAGDAVNISTVY